MSNSITFLVLGVMLGVFSIMSLGTILGFFRAMKKSGENNKKYKESEDKMKAFKKDGGMHQWIRVAIKNPKTGKTEEIYVCELTGYCPIIEGFVPMSSIKQLLSDRKQAAEYEEFKNNALLEIMAEYGLIRTDANILYDKILSIKKDFHIQKMNDFKAEIEAKLGKEVKIITNIDELEEMMGK